VLTAAHCFASDELDQVSVTVGELRVCPSKPDEGGQTVGVEQIFQHPRYCHACNLNASYVPFLHDLALLKLDKDLKFNPGKIEAICLPKKPDKDYTGFAARISGWGALLSTGTLASCKLRETNIKVIATNDTKCKTPAGEIEPDPDLTYQMCAWGKERDACPGDSGGPLAVIEDGNYVLIGLVSYGRKECIDKWVCNVCGLKAAGIYTRVQAYLTWIHSIMQGDPWCPEGFYFDPGNVKGRGFQHQNNQEMGQCAEFCSQTTKCCSFEYSFEHRMCNLNKECKPTNGQFQDFVFCVKNKKGVSWMTNFINDIENLTIHMSELERNGIQPRLL